MSSFCDRIQCETSSVSGLNTSGWYVLGTMTTEPCIQCQFLQPQKMTVESIPSTAILLIRGNHIRQSFVQEFLLQSRPGWRVSFSVTLDVRLDDWLSIATYTGKLLRQGMTGDCLRSSSLHLLSFSFGIEVKRNQGHIREYVTDSLVGLARLNQFEKWDFCKVRCKALYEHHQTWSHPPGLAGKRFRCLSHPRTLP